MVRAIHSPSCCHAALEFFLIITTNYLIHVGYNLNFYSNSKLKFHLGTWNTRHSCFLELIIVVLSLKHYNYNNTSSLRSFERHHRVYD